MNEYIVDYKKGLVETGDSLFIENVMRRALNGEKLTLGFLGGSITQDAVTSEHRFCYAYRVYEWFSNTFPEADFTYVNAGIGATDSEFAAARVYEHLLSYNPDFVLMEHAVNDGCTEHYKETYEGVTRQILSSNNKIALLQMCNVFYNDGNSAELMHRRVSRHYGIPVVSMRPTIYDALLSGNFDNRLITHDDLHPNDDGHGLVAKVVTTYLDSVYEKVISKEHLELIPVQERILPQPLTANRYENSVKYDNRNSLLPGESGEGYQVLAGINGFEKDDTPQEQIRDCFRFGYSGKEKGAFIEYEIEGKCIAIQYRRTINLPAPIAKCVIDGNEADAFILDANFDETWGDKLVLTDVFDSYEDAKHTVRIEIIENHPDDKGDFYLAGLIVSR